MVRKSQRHQPKARENYTLEEFTPKDLPKGAKIKIESWMNEINNEVEHYAMAYINPVEFTKDNGRVLGYDNSHNYHHRHYKGIIEPIEFISFEDITKRFLREVRSLVNGEKI